MAEDMVDEQAPDWAVMGLVAREMVSERSMEAMLDRSLSASCAALHADVGAVWLVDDARGVLSAVAAEGVPIGTLSPVELDDDLRGMTRASCRTLIAHEPRLAGYEPGEEIPEDCDGEHVACLPLRCRGTAAGAIVFARTMPKRPFGKPELGLATALAAQIGLAVGSGTPTGDILSRERVERSLQLAHTLQNVFAPAVEDALDGYRVAAGRIDSLEMGGDFHDRVRLPEGRVVFAVGETSGQGVQAGLNIARVCHELRGILAAGRDPCETVSALNDRLVSQSRRGLFVSLALAMLDPETGRVVATGAGSVNIYLISPEKESIEQIVAGSGSPMGALMGCSYAESERALEPGDVLLMHTDGLPTRAPGFRSADRLLDEISASVEADTPPATHILSGLRRRGEGGPGGPDITIVSVERNG